MEVTKEGKTTVFRVGKKKKPIENNKKESGNSPAPEKEKQGEKEE